MKATTTEARPILAAVTDMVEAFVMANAFPPVMLKVTAGQLQMLKEELEGTPMSYDAVPDYITLYLPTGPMLVEREPQT